MPAFLLMLAAAASAGGPSPAGQCHRIHYLADGTRQETWVKDDGSVTAGSVSGMVTGTGSVSASSHSSASASSGGHSHSSSASSSDGHRSITVTRNDSGCTIVIDERRQPADP